MIDDEGLEQLLVLLDKTEDERLLSGVVHTISNIANSGIYFKSQRLYHVVANTNIL